MFVGFFEFGGCGLRAAGCSGVAACDQQLFSQSMEPPGCRPDRFGTFSTRLIGVQDTQRGTDHPENSGESPETNNTELKVPTIQRGAVVLAAG
jgi:hypothetical protein